MSAILDKIQQNIEAIHPDPFDLEGQDRAMEVRHNNLMIFKKQNTREKNANTMQKIFM